MWPQTPATAETTWLDLFDALWDGELPGRDVHASDSARRWTASSIGYVLSLEGFKVSDEDLLAEIDRRSPGWPGRWEGERRIGPEPRPPNKADPALIEALYPPEGP